MRISSGVWSGIILFLVIGAATLTLQVEDILIADFGRDSQKHARRFRVERSLDEPP